MTSSGALDLAALPDLSKLQGSEWDAAFANILLTALNEEDPLAFLHESPAPVQAVIDAPATEAPVTDKTSSHNQSGSSDDPWDLFINYPDEEVTADPNGPIWPAVDCLPDCKCFSSF